jgi:nucleoside-diphosphate-sugar epimerase
MRVLVTGANGFIGRHLVTRLQREGHRVRAMVRGLPSAPAFPSGVEVVAGDVCDPQSMKDAMAGCEVVFHLAGKVHALGERSSDGTAYQVVNVEGMRHALDGAVSAGARRFVLFSSVKAMGEDTAGCADESCPPDPRTPYGRSKLQAEQVVEECGRRTGMQTVCLRLPMVYGPGQKGNLIRMIAAIDRGIFPPLAEFGNRRSLVHVSNVVQAAMLAATHSAARGCYLVTDSQAHSTRELYEMICRALDRPVSRWHVPDIVLTVLGHLGDLAGRLMGRRASFDSDALGKLTGSAWYSSARIARELGYAPGISFEEALPEMIAQYRSLPA